MSRPVEYDPQQGYKYQIFAKFPEQKRLESVDHAKDGKELICLLNEYRIAYQGGASFSYIVLPKKYWEDK
jgi:hypothetical protein